MVAHEYYVTTPRDLEKMKILRREGVEKEMGEIPSLCSSLLKLERHTGEEQAGEKRTRGTLNVDEKTATYRENTLLARQLV